MAFNKRKQSQMEQFLNDVLASQDTDMLVVRGKDCKTLFLNNSARARLEEAGAVTSACGPGLAGLFPDLCERCAEAAEVAEGETFQFDVTGPDEHIYAGTIHMVNWLDDKPAKVLTLRDVDEARNAHKKLYGLAYIDHLTGVPNRQRFKEDFELVAEDIAEGKLRGMVAIFDLDNFKAINDTYGHNTGDVMLRRLTGHMLMQPEFAGHLYRLGGDEFVLFYTDPTDNFPSDDAYRAHFEKLLQEAFVSYTMPNIEMSCTISMGVAFLPNHGESASELLRKADIALYKAKAAGRNQMVFFEDRYDNAKKFKDLYINIQPILTHLGRSYGYELVDRGNEGKGEENELNLTEFDRTMDALGLGEMENEAKYFIGYTSQLKSDTVRRNLPKGKFVVQINLPANVGDEDLALYQQLKAYGYKLALADLTDTNTPPHLLALADYAKFAPGRMDPVRQKQMIDNYPDKFFIATGVDSVSAFEAAKRRGFKLFQGYFFNEPVVVKKTKDIDPLKVNYLRLLQLTSTEDYVNFREISAVIASDVALSYKLLRLLNSAAVGLRNKISSIDMAVAYLGEESLKKWIAMLALRGVADDKPLELVRMSLIRAQFGELLAPHFNPRRDARHVFLTGMFSLLHIALEKTKEEVLEEIPVADDIRLSILTKTGPHSDLVAFFNNYEYANWDEVSEFARKNGLSDRVINDAYISAVKWYNVLTEGE
ncbi:MAG: diguanylate cyclase [Ruminococcaceae bacterium]|nr:diguanylate cyclase [Oscillospiraceae bacterium]